MRSNRDRSWRRSSSPCDQTGQVRHKGRVFSRVACFGGLLVAFLFFCSPGVSLAETGGSWTNRAGHALKAVPLSISGQNVTFGQGRTGKTVTYPLSIFSETEQERLRCALKDTTLPTGLADAHAFSCRIIKRSRLLNENGTLSEQDFQKELNKTVSAFRAQAMPFVIQKKLSPERLELILHELGSLK